jgi:excisionase family DNA binding protein
MKEIRLQIGITLDRDSATALVDLLAQAVEQGAAQCTQAVTAARSSDEPATRRKMTPLEASQHALFGGQEPPEDRGLLIDTREVSKLLSVSSRKIWSMQVSGRMPAPIRIGRAVRWSYEEIKEWVAAGCPPREKMTRR